MSDERKEWLLAWLSIWVAGSGKMGTEETDAYEQVKQLIQQKPKIDDMKKYVEKKAWELWDAILTTEDIAGVVDKHFNCSGKIGIEKREKFITQIISDVRGREK